MGLCHHNYRRHKKVQQEANDDASDKTSYGTVLMRPDVRTVNTGGPCVNVPGSILNENCLDLNKMVIPTTFIILKYILFLIMYLMKKTLTRKNL